MGMIKPAPAACLFVAIMYPDELRYQSVLTRLLARLGPLMGSGVEYKVDDFTDYYAAELGVGLQKRMLVFEQSWSQEYLYRVKLWTNQLEAEGADDSGTRRVNLDPGYLEPAKLALWSTKNYSHRLYCGEGIFAETTLIYEKLRFKSLPWTYPDFQTPENLEFLLTMRKRIVNRERERRESGQTAPVFRPV